jgi:hypothetical protein
MEKRKMNQSNLITCAVMASAVVSSSALASFQFDVIPGAYTDTPGTGSFVGPHANGQRINQMLVHESLLTNLIGRELTGISFRLPANASAPWPATDVAYSAYEIYLSQGVAPADRSFTFSENVVGPQTQVRSGPLVVNAGDYPFGNSPNEFGTEIGFNTGWTYTGGHLLVELRHTGHGSVGRAMDALTTGTAGYGELFSALWSADLGATTGSQGNFVIFQLSSLPAPGALAMLGVAGMLGGRRRR